jgi:tRNA 5-methylaminomethyl-2-thiouridine biosynthesis bifunctional protein
MVDAPSGHALRWDENGVPYSVVFDDKYFCREYGYDEAVYVGCGGNDLKARFLALDPSVPGVFTIMETGFGTGLDFCCAWQLWEKCAPSSWSLHFVSLELYPLGVDHIGRALGLWPVLDPYKVQLLSRYKPMPGEIGRFVLADGRMKLTIVFDDVVLALRRIKEEGLAPERADAWFLDGFGPAKNPQMWTTDVFKGMASLSKKGATLSTFTVAGAVRRGLEAEGFRVQKIPGHGRKNLMLTGRYAGA